MKRLVFVLGLCVSLACATSPTGRKQLMLVSDSQMNSMGVEAFSGLKRDKPIETDPAIRNYVECVAQAVAMQATDETGVEEWEVVVFRDDSANAFALPGGKIGVHTGLLAVAETPDQLAAVIGHEIGHVIARHSSERMSQQLAAVGGLTIAGFASKDMSSGDRAILLGALGAGATVGVLLPYSRTHESEADVIGLDLMARAGFDPRDAVQLWRNMAAQGNARVPEFISTHPAPATRIENLESHMDDALATYEHARSSGFRPSCRLP